MEKKEDHDLLISVVKDVSWIKNIMGNHLKHHWGLEVALVIALLMALASKIWG